MLCLLPCTTVIHINSTASAGNAGRDDREAMLVMRERSRPVLDAVQRHGGLHLILVGTLRVHPQWEEGEPYYGSDSTVAPRDVAAEGQLWMEERALEQATPERPVSVIRASNVQGSAHLRAARQWVAPQMGIRGPDRVGERPGRWLRAQGLHPRAGPG